MLPHFHMLRSLGHAATTQVYRCTNGLSLASFTGMADVNSDIGLLAGYLIASVPFLAGGVAKGAMAISLVIAKTVGPGGSEVPRANGQRLADLPDLRMAQISSVVAFDRTIIERQMSTLDHSPQFLAPLSPEEFVLDSIGHQMDTQVAGCRRGLQVADETGEVARQIWRPDDDV